MGVKLTPELLGAYLEVMYREAVTDLEDVKASLSHSVLGDEVYDGMYTSLWRRQERVDWFKRLLAVQEDGSIPPVNRDLAYHVTTVRQEALGLLLDFNPAGRSPLAAAKMITQRAAIRHVYDDLDPGAIEVWLRQNGRIEGDGLVTGEEIEALVSRDAVAVMELAVRALEDGEEKLAVALMRGIEEDGAPRAGYLLTLAASRARELRSE